MNGTRSRAKWIVALFHPRIISFSIAVINVNGNVLSFLFSLSPYAPLVQHMTTSLRLASSPNECKMQCIAASMILRIRPMWCKSRGTSVFSYATSTVHFRNENQCTTQARIEPYLLLERCIVVCWQCAAMMYLHFDMAVGQICWRTRKRCNSKNRVAARLWNIQRSLYQYVTCVKKQQSLLKSSCISFKSY